MTAATAVHPAASAASARSRAARRAVAGKISEILKGRHGGAWAIYPVVLDEIEEPRGCHRTGRSFRDRMD
jgi:hypothetical protein